jgi:prolyl-tRNA synthetase
MNLIGSPFQIIIGKQTDDNLVEFKEIDQESKKIKLEQAIKIIKEQKEKN